MKIQVLEYAAAGSRVKSWRPLSAKAHDVRHGIRTAVAEYINAGNMTPQLKTDGTPSSYNWFTTNVQGRAIHIHQENLKALQPRDGSACLEITYFYEMSSFGHKYRVFITNAALDAKYKEVNRYVSHR